MPNSRTVVAVFACTMLASAWIVAQDPEKAYFGTWKLNVAKSKFDPGPGPKELTRIHEDAGGGQIRVTTKGVNPDGTSGSTTYTFRPDGKDVPVTGGRGPGMATVAITRVDPYTATFINKVDGKVTTTGKRVLSKDGKTMTITGAGTSPQGQKTSSTQVFEKQ